MLDTGGSQLWMRLMGGLPAADVPFLDGPEDPERPRRLALVLAYRGSDFLGWQLQKKGPTVQGALERELSRLEDRPVRVAAAGRTDTGVHAWGQVAVWDSHSRLPLPRLREALTSMLPSSVRPLALGRVAPDFHPRYAARGKTYHYYLAPDTPLGLFLEGLAWPLNHPLDREAMQEALELLTGVINLGAFASHGGDLEGDTHRLITRADLDTGEPGSGGLWRLRFTGSGFLRHAVRNMVGTLVQVGRGRLTPAQVGEMLQAGRRLFAGPKAPPGGLYLYRVYYQSPLPGPGWEE